MTSATVAHPAADLDELTLVRELTYRIIANSRRRLTW
jgi:hypothetical protein